ncbi:hypothetical protein [Bacillus cereus]|uniref:hypothetical protein n=1 Tax=Bacillus cereus TaxID=1396 RepID=UPI0009430497|nr:hypothetical protein BHL35_00555 [Bacillus cereus]
MKEWHEKIQHHTLLRMGLKAGILDAYDSQEIRETEISIGIQMIIAINERNGTRKDTYGGGIPAILHTALGIKLFNLRNGSEYSFYTLKYKGMEYSHMFGYSRSCFYVQPVYSMHNVGYLLCFFEML